MYSSELYNIHNETEFQADVIFQNKKRGNRGDYFFLD